jgi:hypothetical protein
MSWYALPAHYRAWAEAESRREAEILAKRAASAPTLAKRATVPAGRTVFVEITSVLPAAGGGIMASGAAAIEKGHAFVLADTVLREMAGADPAGEVVSLDTSRGGAFVRARITDRVAAEKVRQGVYKGFGVWIAADDRVERVALLDHPDAMAKGARREAPRLLKLSVQEASPMSRLSKADLAGIVRSPLVDTGEVARIIREHGDRVAHEARLGKRGTAAQDYRQPGTEADALDVIKAALRQAPIRPSFAYGHR